MNKNISIAVKVTIASLKALFESIVAIAWGIAGFFLLIALINNYNIDKSVIKPLLDIISWITTYWWIFWLAILFYYGYINYKELTKNNKRQNGK